MNLAEQIGTWFIHHFRSKAEETSVKRVAARFAKFGIPLWIAVAVLVNRRLK